MFDESSEGSTHSENDGCGEAAHNCKLCYGKGYTTEIIPCKCRKPVELNGIVSWTPESSLEIAINFYVRKFASFWKRVKAGELRKAFQAVAWLALQEAEIEVCKKCQKKIINIKANLYK
jgi:hypothetical protein